MCAMQTDGPGHGAAGGGPGPQQPGRGQPRHPRPRGQHDPGGQALRHQPHPPADRADHQAPGGGQAQDARHLLQCRHQGGAPLPAPAGRAENSGVLIPHALTTVITIKCRKNFIFTSQA